MDELERIALLDCRPAEAVAAFNACYARYVVPLAMTVERFERRFRGEDVDPLASHIWLLDGRPAALLLIARRGRASRFAAFGVAEALRGRGFGERIGAWAIDEAQARGDSHVWLEVFEVNERARALYARLGFEEHSRLVGFTHDGPPEPIWSGGTREASILEGVEIGSRHSRSGNLPWMLDPATLASSVAPVRCFVNSGERVAAFVDPSLPEVRLIGILGSMEPTGAAGFLGSLCALFPSRAWSAPQILPEDYAGAYFEAAGWVRSELAQSRMLHALGSSVEA